MVSRWRSRFCLVFLCYDDPPAIAALASLMAIKPLDVLLSLAEFSATVFLQHLERGSSAVEELSPRTFVGDKQRHASEYVRHRALFLVSAFRAELYNRTQYG